MADEEGGKEAEKKIVHVYPLVKVGSPSNRSRLSRHRRTLIFFPQHSDMNEEMRIEAIEMTILACEKYSANYEHAAKVIKETMDKKFGIYWHVVVGEAFGFEVSYETENILYLFFAGNLAIVLWKCS
ncbi:hypothetical protein KR018_002408 [Drosophila ironensis]|nr:hypothetical protein KR018_002408 [Drosophila ironensis]